MRYFEVVAKCGHVGRDKYYEGHFFVDAASASQAARKVKRFHRVKKDHEDAILGVRQIGEKAYLSGRERFENEAYFNCHSKYQQKEVWDEVMINVRNETPKQLAYRESQGIRPRETGRGHHNKNIIRNPYKWAKYNRIDDINIDDIDDYSIIA